jgi:hypothetical protein
MRVDDKRAEEIARAARSLGNCDLGRNLQDLLADRAATEALVEAAIAWCAAKDAYDAADGLRDDECEAACTADANLFAACRAVYEASRTTNEKEES